MRGKLRDKRADSKRDPFKREVIERRRLNKRDNRSLSWLNQQPEDEEDNSVIEEENDAPVAETTKK